MLRHAIVVLVGFEVGVGATLVLPFWAQVAVFISACTVAAFGFWSLCREALG